MCRIEPPWCDRAILSVGRATLDARISKYGIGKPENRNLTGGTVVV